MTRILSCFTNTIRRRRDGCSGCRIPEPERQRIDELEECELSANSRKTYLTGWRSWCRWAAHNGISEQQACPCTLRRWLSALWDEGKQATTLRTYWAGVKHYLDSFQGPNPARDMAVAKLLCGIARKAAITGRTSKQAAPLRLAHLGQIGDTAHLPRRNQRGGRMETPEQASIRGDIDVAMLYLAYEAALRSSELRDLTWADIVPSEHGYGGTVHIRRSKTDQTGQGVHLPISESMVQALARMRPEGAKPHDRIFDFSANTITRRMRAAAQAAGFDPARITSHSPRIGMAQDLAAAGIGLPALLQACRWKNTATAARYTQHIEAQQSPAALYLEERRSPRGGQRARGRARA